MKQQIIKTKNKILKKAPGRGFEPRRSIDHRISSPTPYQAGPSRLEIKKK